MDLAVFIFDIDGFTTKLSQGSLMVWESRLHHDKALVKVDVKKEE